MCIGSHNPHPPPLPAQGEAASMRACMQSFGDCGVNFFEDIAHPEAKLPVWIMRLELSHVADPPDVVADAIGFLVAPV
jgi:hypothetical protein